MFPLKPMIFFQWCSSLTPCKVQVCSLSWHTHGLWCMHMIIQRVWRIQRGLWWSSIRWSSLCIRDRCTRLLLHLSYGVWALQEQLGDYSHFMDSKEFYCEVNFFADLESLSLLADITPKQHKLLSSRDCVMAGNWTDFHNFYLYKPLCWHFQVSSNVELLTSLSTRFTNGYLITRVIQYSSDTQAS